MCVKLKVPPAKVFSSSLMACVSPHADQAGHGSLKSGLRVLDLDGDAKKGIVVESNAVTLH